MFSAVTGGVLRVGKNAGVRVADQIALRGCGLTLGDAGMQPFFTAFIGHCSN